MAVSNVFESFALFFRVFGRPNRARSSPTKVQPMEYAANRLPAYHEDSLLEQLQSKELATPARTKPATLGGQRFFGQLLNQFLGRIVNQRRWTSPLAILEGDSPLLDETSDDGVNGGARAEEGSGDLGG